jgi:hypothetical protein
MTDKKVVICVPTIVRPHPAMLGALREEAPHMEAAGFDHAMVCEIGNPYISAARAVMLRKALDAKATHIFFIDHDVSWKPGDLTKVLTTEGGLVAGTYRFKKDEEVYMGIILDGPDGTAQTRADGAIAATRAPAGFMKIERAAVAKLIKRYPELVYGDLCKPDFDLFNHGAHEGTWWGEDYACCRRWVDMGERLWIVPDIDVDHHAPDKVYPGNLHRFLLRQPGGSEATQ